MPFFYDLPFNLDGSFLLGLLFFEALLIYDFGESESSPVTIESSRGENFVDS